MRQPIQRPTVFLSSVAFAVYRKVVKTKPHGWFSNYVSEKLIEDYSKEMGAKLLTEELNEKTKSRNELDKDIEKIAKKLAKIRR